MLSLSLSFTGGKRASDDQCRWFTSGLIVDSNLFEPGYTCADGVGQYNNSKWSESLCCNKSNESVMRKHIFILIFRKCTKLWSVNFSVVTLRTLFFPVYINQNALHVLDSGARRCLCQYRGGQYQPERIHLDLVSINIQ